MSKRNFILFFLLFINSISLFSQTEIMRKKHWLWYMAEGGMHESVIREMDIQLKPQFEELLDKKLNWDRIWLFSSDSRLFNYAVNGKKRSTLTPIQLMFKSYWIKASLKWHCVTDDKWIDMSESIKPGEIKFDLSILNDGFKDDFPGPEDTIVLKTLDIKAYFSVKLINDYIPHDGFFFIELDDENEFNKLEKVINDVIDRWNEDDTVIMDKNAYDRGKVHNVGMEGKDENVYSIYYDQGSASYDFFDYIISRISEEVKGIKSFIIGSIEE